MYYTRCTNCGAYLDPCEKCDCIEEIEKYKQKLSALTKPDKDGQLRMIL